MRTVMFAVTLLLSGCVTHLVVDTPDDWPPFVGGSGEGPWVEDDGSVEWPADDADPLCFTNWLGGIDCIVRGARCGTDTECDALGDLELSDSVTRGVPR